MKTLAVLYIYLNILSILWGICAVGLFVRENPGARLGKLFKVFFGNMLLFPFSVIKAWKNNKF